VFCVLCVVLLCVVCCVLCVVCCVLCVVCCVFCLCVVLCCVVCVVCCVLCVVCCVLCVVCCVLCVVCCVVCVVCCVVCVVCCVLCIMCMHSVFFSSLFSSQERKILFISSHFSLLTLAAESFLSLLFPFDWHHAYIPILPSAMFDYLAAPCPFIIGIQKDILADVTGGTTTVKLNSSYAELPVSSTATSLSTSLNSLSLSGVMVVDLDDGYVRYFPETNGFTEVRLFFLFFFFQIFKNFFFQIFFNFFFKFFFFK
jgi:hypothetical protein